MVTADTTVSSSNADLSEIAKAKQGKVTGIIIPPPEIRAVVDKTAQFVARNGKSFENKILESSEGKTAKFNFMKAYDPYHAYYEKKISEFEGGGPAKAAPAASSTDTGAPVQEKSAPQRDVRAEQTTATAKASFTTPIAKFAMMKVTEAPPPLEFSVGHPSGLSSLDSDIMKLAAQYTALNGREFLTGLAQREQRNPQFDFLKPTHMLFSYFTTLVDAYAKILQPSGDQLKNVKEKSTKMGALEKSVQRWQWERAEDERKKREDSEADAERSAYQAIDWYDFSVVETIEFDEDELYEPAGMLPGYSAATNTATKQNEEEDMDIDMDMDEDMDEDTEPPPVAPPPPPPAAEEEHVEELSEDEDDGEIKVVTDYQPRTAQSGKLKQATTMLDPISGKPIAMEQMSEHMRVQLMDPRWRVEQQRFLDKQQDTGYAEGSSIADSLKQFAKQRGDICGSAEEEEARLLADEGKRKKRIEETNRIIWDGHQSSIDAVKRQKLEMESQQAPPKPEASSSSVSSAGSAAGRTVGPTSQPPAAPSSYFPPQPPAFFPPQPPLHAPPPSYYPPPPPQPMQPPATSEAFPRPHAPLQSALLPAEEFARRFPTPIKIHVNIPSDSSSSWELRGQTVTVSIHVTQSVKELKESISPLVGGMPANKQQLKGVSGFLKDKETLAGLNIGDATTLDLSVRSRGGKR